MLVECAEAVLIGSPELFWMFGYDDETGGTGKLLAFLYPALIDDCGGRSLNKVTLDSRSAFSILFFSFPWGLSKMQKLKQWLAHDPALHAHRPALPKLLEYTLPHMIVP